MDELLGSALLALHLGEEPEVIERIDSQDASKMVSDGNLPENTYFIDCGMVYDSGRKLYDHHQDRELESAALLLFKEFFPHLIGTDLHNYLNLVSKVDTRGAMSLDDFSLIGESKEYLSFGHNLLLKNFQENTMLILKIFITGLEDKISFEKDRAQAALWLKEEGHIEIIKISDLNILRYLKKPPSVLVSPLRSAIAELIDENNVSSILSFDDKQADVRTFYRTDSGHDLVDFSRCKPTEQIFNHQSGFLMKFIPSDEQEWITLFQQAKL